LFISTYVAKLVAGTILQLIFVHLVHIVCVKNQFRKKTAEVTKESIATATGLYQNLFATSV
jgi:phage-related protein